MQNCLTSRQAVFIYDNQRLPQLTINRSINKNPLFVEVVYFQAVTDIIGQYRLILLVKDFRYVQYRFQYPQYL